MEIPRYLIHETFFGMPIGNKVPLKNKMVFGNTVRINFSRLVVDIKPVVLKFNDEEIALILPNNPGQTAAENKVIAKKRFDHNRLMRGRGIELHGGFTTKVITQDFSRT